MILTPDITNDVNHCNGEIISQAETIYFF